jgi:hypothetical protein
MVEIEINNGLMTFRSINLNYSIYQIDEFGVYVQLQNETNDFITYLVADEVSINGIVQTSAQMIIDTLNNG